MGLRTFNILMSPHDFVREYKKRLSISTNDRESSRILLLGFNVARPSSVILELDLFQSDLK